eukprot:6480904-Amphidinium_carterae.1
MERVRRDLEDEKARAIQAGRLHDYSPSQPWEHVFAVVVKDAGFWHRELEEPCQNLRLKGTYSEPDRIAPLLPSAPTPKRKPQRERVHRVQDGHFVSNRQGVALCKAWQEGSCQGSSSGNRCPRNPDLTHQCSKCLSPDHGSNDCTSKKEVAAASQPPRFRKGSGKRGGRN